MPELLALVAAPMILAAATPAPALDLRLLAVLGAMALSVVPLLRGLGPAWPRPRAYIILAGAFAVAAGFFLTPPGAILAASDLAVGSAVVALAAGTVAFSSLPP